MSKSNRGVWTVAIAGLLLAGGLGAAPKAEVKFSDADRQYWAFQKVERPKAPAGQNHPVDAFIAAKLAEKDLEIAPAADKITLIRRAYFDLIGLPPTPEQVEAFLADRSPEAFSMVVDELLASPHYGERWGRHWLDLARYAESEGFKSDETRPYAWRYRDYVIRAFNEDKPYDRFVQEQIAGDELWPNDVDARIATGFNRNYPDESNAANLVQRRAELLQDVTDAVGATFMGLTFGCAKCHDHKFDPILQADYYRLQAFFAASAQDDDIILMSDADRAEYDRKLAAWEEAAKDIRAERDAMLDAERRVKWEHLFGKRLDETQDALSKAEAELNPFERQMWHKHLWQVGFFEKSLYKALKGEQKERYLELTEQLEKFEHLHPGELPRGAGLKDLGVDAPETRILGLANYAAPQDEVEPGFLTILNPGPVPVTAREDLSSTGRRTALAKWLTETDNPLTARVMANRIWHHHFGRGIVATPSDFGRMGEAPTHPELLDWLTSEFVDKGWSIKGMHRLIMTSRTYQQGSDHIEEAKHADPFNRLLWRFPPQRLEGEVIRDSMLATSGMLNTEVGGPSVFPPLPSGMPTPRGGWAATEDPEQQRRRSVYIFVRRNARYPMMHAFDMPDTHESCARREVTTTAPQALSLLNDEQTIEWSQGFAARVLENAGADSNAQVEQAYLLAYSRKPDAAEQDEAQTFLAKQREVIVARTEGKTALPAYVPEGMDPASAAAFVDFSHTLLNSNEFVYRF